MVGESFGIADIGLGTTFVHLRHGGESIDGSRWPRLAAYLERVLARESFATVIVEEEAAFPS